MLVTKKNIEKKGEFMKHSTRLILEMKDNIIFLKRRKKVDGKIKEFYVLPGGMLDEGETWEQAGIREAKEELDVDIKIEKLLIEEYNEDLDKLERFYFAKIVKGIPKNGKGEEFENQSIENKYGTYQVVKLNKKEIGAYNILPVSIKDLLVSIYI